LDCSEFARILQRAVVSGLAEFRRQRPDESPYALAIILGQVGNYLGFAVATEEGLQRVASNYADDGYRYQGWNGENSDNLEYLANWLRWANPDDGWHYCDFPDCFGIAALLADLVKNGAFGEDAEELEGFCIEVLAALQADPEWASVVADNKVVVGVTFGSDPRDFLRSATRANEYRLVRQLWAEHWRGEELSNKIPPPS